MSVRAAGAEGREAGTTEDGTLTDSQKSLRRASDLLCEAVGLEHALVCQYLFAAFSLKTGDDEGLELISSA